MKAFIFSIAVIILIITISSVLSVYICKQIESMTEVCNEIIADNSYQNNVTKMVELQCKWDNLYLFLGIFVSKPTVEEAQLAISLLKDFVYKNDLYGITYSKRLLISALDDIKIIEGIGFSSIF